MIAAVLVYNTAFYMVQSLSLIVYSSNEKPCLCLALWLLGSYEPLKAAKNSNSTFFVDVESTMLQPVEQEKVKNSKVKVGSFSGV